ncbi:hypothetical protein [Luethyella okanaganae]|uniref:Ribosomally synthesized peptide with SipW-like signal peptide n=1 Tax=Luethyella okanaganae TaxID=69372 RepID=A0ABW1VF45_9MICO
MSSRIPSHRRRRPLFAVVAVGAIALAALPVAATWAAFTDGVTASSSQSGAVDVAQDAVGAQQYADRTTPRIVAGGTPGSVAPIAYLSTAPSSDPGVATAAFAVDVYLTSSSRDVALSATFYDPSGSAAAFGWLVFGVYVGDKSVLPGGVPLSAEGIAALGGGTGVALPVPAVDEAVTVTVKAWLAPGAPPAAFGVSVEPGVAVTAETVGGRTVTAKETIG